MYSKYEEVAELQPTIITDFVTCKYYIDIKICEIDATFSDKLEISLPITIDLGEVSKESPAVPPAWNPQIMDNQQEPGRLPYLYELN